MTPLTLMAELGGSAVVGMTAHLSYGVPLEGSIAIGAATFAGLLIADATSCNPGR